MHAFWKTNVGSWASGDCQSPEYGLVCTGGDSEVAQQLSADRLQSQVQQLLTGLAEAKSGSDASIQQPAGIHATSQQASASQAGKEGNSVEQNATRLPQPLQEAEMVEGGHNSSAQVAATSQHLAAAAVSEAAEAMSAKGVAQLPVPVAAALPPGWTVIHSQVNPGRRAAAMPFQLPPPQLPAHAQVPPAGQPGPCESPCNVSDLLVQQVARQDIPADPPQQTRNQDGRHRTATADLACREGLRPSMNTQSVDVGGPSCIQPLQQAAEASAAGTYQTAETASIDIVGSCALVAPAAERIQGGASRADTASIDIIEPDTVTALPRATDDGDAVQPGQLQVGSSGQDSAAGQDTAPTSMPSDACARHGGDGVQQSSQAASQEAAAGAGKRSPGEQWGAASKQLKLRRTLRELDVEPSSALTLSTSEWLPAQPAKTRQQALAGQQLRKLRGRQIPVPGAAPAAAGSKGYAGSGLLAAASPPPGIASAAHEQHVQAGAASAGAQEAAEAAAEHASRDGEAVQHPPVSERHASEAGNPPGNAQLAQPAEQAAPSHVEPHKGSRELNSLLTSTLAMPGHPASGVPLCRQSIGRTRAHSAVQPGTSEAPVSKRKKASTGELAKLLEAAAAVSPKQARSAPLHLQAHGRTRAQSTPKHSASDQLLSLRKDKKPNRELARLLHAAAEVAPKDASSAPLCLGPTRGANAQSQPKPSVEDTAPAPVQTQAEEPLQSKPKPMRGFRELAALHDGLLAQVLSQPGRRHPVGQLGSWAAQTRWAGQLAAGQGGGIAKRTRQQDLSPGGHAAMASSGRQISSAPHVKQTARKQVGSNPALIARASPVRLTARKANRAPAMAARASAAAPSKARLSAGGSAPTHTVLKRRGLALKSAAIQARKGIARTLAKGPHKHCGTAEGQGSVASQAVCDPQQPDEAAARRSQRAAAGGRLRQVLRQVKNPIQAAKAELMQSRAARGNLLRQKIPGRAAQTQQPLRPMPIEEAPSPSTATACNWGGSQRRSREALRGVQRLVDACKLPRSALKPSAGGKRLHHSADSTRPSKRLCPDQQPDHAEAQHRSAAAGPMPDWETELPGGSMPSVEQGSGVPVVCAPGLPTMPSMQHSWSLPAPQADAHRLLRPHQEFTVIGTSKLEPLQRSPGEAAVRHAAYVASRGGAAAPRIAAAEAARPVLQERSKLAKRYKSQQAAHMGMPGRPGQKAPAPGQPRAPKQMRQAAGLGQGMHVPAPARSQPAGDRPHSKTARAMPQAGAPNGACKAAETQADAISPQGEVSQHATCNLTAERTSISCSGMHSLCTKVGTS